jgi:hypothetical protein
MSVLHEIQKKLKVGKGNENTFGGYKYRNCSDILEAVKPLLPEGYCLTLSDDIVMLGDRYYVKATARLIGGECHDVTAFARESFSKKGMDDSQITGAASSYARKYALNGLFAIDDTDDADSMDNRKHETVKPDPAPKTMPSNQTIGENEFFEINKLLDDTGSDKSEFCKYFKIQSVAGLPLSQYAKATAMLAAKLKKGDAP